jgi:hypothetical protein
MEIKIIHHNQTSKSQILLNIKITRKDYVIIRKLIESHKKYKNLSQI